MHALWLRRGLRLRKLLCLRGLLMDLPCLLQLCVLLLFLPPRIIVCHIFWLLRALSAVQRPCPGSRSSRKLLITFCGRDVDLIHKGTY